MSYLNEKYVLTRKSSIAKMIRKNYIAKHVLWKRATFKKKRIKIVKRKNYLSRRDSLKKEGLYQKKELHSTGTFFTKKDFDEFGRAGLERVQAGKKNWDLWSVLEARERESGIKKKELYEKEEFHEKRVSLRRKNCTKKNKCLKRKWFKRKFDFQKETKSWMKTDDLCLFENEGSIWKERRLKGLNQESRGIVKGKSYIQKGRAWLKSKRYYKTEIVNK